jgi:hypothetical protein
MSVLPRGGWLPACKTIVVSGGVFAHAPRAAQAALIVLDALEPVGIVRLVLDTQSLVAPLGSIAAVAPLAVVEALEADGYVDLAAVVAPVGRARPGRVVLSAQIEYDEGGKLGVEVRSGDLEVLPLGRGQEAVLDLRPRRGFDVGLGGPGRGGRQRVTGGLAGLIIDARGRPLVLASDPEERVREARRWLSDIGG